MTTTVEIADWGRLPASPVVSVCIITYNHERFIAQAIESVLMQETDFPVELVIGEDCSADGTRETALDNARRHPERIRLLLHEHNLGMMPNFVATLQACRGQYIALVEGDDYWTDPHKLQNQVDFLESHPDYALCFHATYKLFQDTGQVVIEKPNLRRPYYELDDILGMRIGIWTVSVMFRRALVLDLPAWYFEAPVGDTPLFALLSKQGKIGYIDQVMATYRVHDGGVWQGSSELARTRMNRETLLALRKHFGHRHERLFRIPISNNYLNQARLSADLGDDANAKTYIKKSIATSFTLRGKWVDQVAMLGRLYLPREYGLAKRILRVK